MIKSVLHVVALIAGSTSLVSAELPQLPNPMEISTSQTEPTCIDTTLLDETLIMTFCVDPLHDHRWRASADFIETPIETLLLFLPEDVGTLRGGTVSGQMEIEGSSPGGMAYDPGVLIQGTLCADSLWWPATRTHSEWTLLNASFCFDLGLRGDAAHPLVEGSVVIEDGIVRYLGHEFPATVFQITFLDTTRFDPFIDLAAFASVESNTGKSYFVRFDIVGPASQAKPQLTSSPSLTPQDIESLLALGIPLTAFSDEHVRRSEGSYWAQQVFMFRAMEVAADRMVGIAEERAQRVLGMDEIYVPTARGLASGSAEMGVAKRLGSRATLSYSTPMWHLGAYRARLDFRLTNHFSLESENDHTGDSGVDLRFKVRWR